MFVAIGHPFGVQKCVAALFLIRISIFAFKPFVGSLEEHLLHYIQPAVAVVRDSLF